MSKSYIVKYVKNYKELNWEVTEKADVTIPQWLPDVGITAAAKVCYDNSNLYVRLEAVEKDITARHKGLYDMVCEDSCLEFFFCPMEGDNRYFNFEMNPNGSAYIGFGYSNPENIRLIINKAADLFQIKPFNTEKGWGVEYKIPYTFIQTFFPEFKITHGSEMRGNFYKCGDLSPKPHYYAWNEITCEKPDFHTPEYFGKIIFE